MNITLKEKIDNMTLRELINETKNFDVNYGFNTEISVYITAIGNDNKRHTVMANPDSLTDKLAIISCEDCHVSKKYCYNLSGKDYLMIIIVDLDEHDRWWRNKNEI